MTCLGRAGHGVGVGVADGHAEGLEVLDVEQLRGAAQFRRSLIDATGGPVGIFTGEAPFAVLEAGHLYSYAKVGEHHAHGGFLMRRDLHRLFDLGLLAIHPESLTIDLSPALTAYPTYGGLAGKKLATPV